METHVYIFFIDRFVFMHRHSVSEPGLFRAFFLSTGVWVREGHDAPVQAPARPARLLLKKQMLVWWFNLVQGNISIYDFQEDGLRCVLAQGAFVCCFCGPEIVVVTS